MSCIWAWIELSALHPPIATEQICTDRIRMVCTTFSKCLFYPNDYSSKLLYIQKLLFSIVNKHRRRDRKNERFDTSKNNFNPIGIVIQVVEHLLWIRRGFESIKMFQGKPNKQLKYSKKCVCVCACVFICLSSFFQGCFDCFNDCVCPNGKQKQMEWIIRKPVARRERTTVRRWMGAEYVN